MGFGCAHLLLKFFHPAQSIDKLHFTGKKRVAGGTDFHADLSFGRTGGKTVAAGAGNDAVIVIGWMNLGFHKSRLYTFFGKNHPPGDDKYGYNHWPSRDLA